MSTKPTWRNIFLELTLRAITQIHYKYNVWELGQEKLTLDEFKKLNQGRGIHYAPEEHVRDGISQQIIETGIWKEHSIDGENRSYIIDREFQVKIPFKDLVTFDTEQELIKDKKYYKDDLSDCEKIKNFNVDIVFKRIQDINKKDNTTTIPSLIEAKRYRLANIDLIKKEVSIGLIQKEGIDRDILKLRAIHGHVKKSGIEFCGKKYNKAFTYLLLWGEGTSTFDLKKELEGELAFSRFIDWENLEIRRVPMTWSNENTISVSSFIWVSLLPIKVD